MRLRWFLIGAATGASLFVIAMWVMLASISVVI